MDTPRLLEAITSDDQLERERALAMLSALQMRSEEAARRLDEIAVLLQKLPSEWRATVREMAWKVIDILAAEERALRPRRTLRTILYTLGMAGAFGAGLLHGCPPQRRSPATPVENPERDKQAPERPGPFGRDCPPLWMPGEDEGCRNHDKPAEEHEDPYSYPDVLPRQNRLRR